MCIPNKQIIPLIPLTLRNPRDCLPRRRSTLMQTPTREQSLRHLAKRRIRPVSKQITMRTVTTQKHPLPLALLCLDPCQSSEVPFHMARRIDQVERPVVEEIICVRERT